MIAIRPARSEDVAEIAAIYAPHVLDGIVSFETEVPDADAMRARMAAFEGLYPWIVATQADDDQESGVVLGYAYATRFRERPAYRYVVETSIYMDSGAQRRGAGRLLYEALINTLRAQGFVSAIGAIALPNDASIALHEAVGFRRAGVYREVGYKRGQWIDVGVWQCMLNDRRTPPAEPRRFADIGVVRR